MADGATAKLGGPSPNRLAEERVGKRDINTGRHTVVNGDDAALLQVLEIGFGGQHLQQSQSQRSTEGQQFQGITICSAETRQPSGDEVGEPVGARQHPINSPRAIDESQCVRFHRAQEQLAQVQHVAYSSHSESFEDSCFHRRVQDATQQFVYCLIRQLGDVDPGRFARAQSGRERIVERLAAAHGGHHLGIAVGDEE